MNESSFNILIACDQKYYDDWGVPLLKSIRHYNPWISLHCHIVNPDSKNELSFVDYTYEDISFVNEDSRVGYLQAVRFLIADSKFKSNQYVMTLDADTICTKSFIEEDFFNLFKHNTILRHPKDGRWLAGLVCLGPNDFRKEFSARLLEQPIEEWKFGRDQDILALLATKHKFNAVSKTWISIGKNGLGSVFLTLKGTQKYSEKYLKIYNEYIKEF